MGNLRVGLLLDAGQVFQGLRQVNKELLGLQRTQERFNQLQTNTTFTKQTLAAQKEALGILQGELIAQKQLVQVAREVAAEDARRLQNLKAIIKEEQGQRRERIEAARRELALDRDSGFQRLQRADRERLLRNIELERRAGVDSELRANQQIRSAERQLGASREDVRVNQELLRLKEEETRATARFVAQAEKATEAERKRLVISENIRDAILALGFGAALQNLNKFAAEAALLAARVENLGTVLRNLGTVSGNSLGQLALYEQQVKDLGITTQATRQVLSLLAANQQDLSQSAQLARIAQDAAAIAGINSSEAAERLVIAVERLDTRLLRSLGIVVNLREVYARFARETGRAAETLSAAEKQQLLYNAVVERGSAIQGTYEASLRDAFKQFTSLDRITQEARKEYGERFVPVFEKYVEVVTKGTQALREANKAVGAEVAGLQTFVTVGGAALVASIALSRGWALLASSGAAATSVSYQLGRATGSLLLNINPLVLGISALAAAYVYLGATAREAAQRNRDLFDGIRSDTARGVEIQTAVNTIRNLGSVSSRTADQQAEFARSMRIITSLFPAYSARLKAAEKDTQAFEQVLREAGYELGVFDETAKLQAENRARQFGDKIFSEFSRAKKALGTDSGFGQAAVSQEALRDFFGFGPEDLDVLSGKITDASKRAEVLKKITQASDRDGAQAAALLTNAVGKNVEGLSGLIDGYKRAATEAAGLREAQDAVSSQRFARELERQAAAVETFEDEIKRQRTESRKALEGTAAEEIDQILRIGEAVAVRFKSEDELRKGAETRKRLDIASAEKELGFIVAIAEAKFAAESDDKKREVLRLEAQKAKNALDARIGEAERKATETVEEGLKQAEIRNKALSVANERLQRSIDLNKQALEAAKTINDIEAAGLRGRARGGSIEAIAAQVQQTANLVEVALRQEEIKNRIREVEKETNVQLDQQVQLYNKLVQQNRPENAQQIKALQDSILKAREAEVTAVQQLNQELRKTQIEVQKLAQDQLDDLKKLTGGLKDAQNALAEFTSGSSAAQRQRANQKVLVEERQRLEDAGASQIEVEARLAAIQEEQAQAQAKKREELEKNLRTEQQRARGAAKEQRQIEQGLKAQGLDPRQRGRVDPFAEERKLRTQETDKVLGLLNPKTPTPGVTKPGEAEAALLQQDVTSVAMKGLLEAKAAYNNQITQLRETVKEAVVLDTNFFSSIEGLVEDTKARFQALNSQFEQVSVLLNREATRTKNNLARSAR